MKAKGTLLFILIYAICIAQDIHFSQFTETPLILNPALTAGKEDLRGILNYKNQWASVSSPYKTFGASFDFNFHQLGWERKKNLTGIFSRSVKNSGLGLFFYKDQAGTSKWSTTQFGVTLSTAVKINSYNRFFFGLLGGYNQHSIDFSKLTWNSQYNGMAYDPNLATGESFTSNSFGHFDFALGLNWLLVKEESSINANNESFGNFGLSVSHFNRPDYEFISEDEKLNVKLNFHSDLYQGIKGTKFNLNPQAMLALQYPATELFFGTFVMYDFLADSKFTGIIKQSSAGLGVFYRNRDAIFTAIKIELSSIHITVGYDVNISKLTAASQYKGGIEISLKFVNRSHFIYQNKGRI